MVKVLQILIVLLVFQVNNSKVESSSFTVIRKLQDRNGKYIGTLLGKKIGDQLYSDIIVTKNRKSFTDTLFNIRKSELFNKNGWGDGVGNYYDGYRIENVNNDRFDYFLLKKNGPSSDNQTIHWNETSKVFEVFNDEP